MSDTIKVVTMAIACILAVSIVIPAMNGAFSGDDGDCLIADDGGCAAQDILPCSDNAYDLGSSTARWNDVYGMNIRGVSLNISGDSATIGGNDVVREGYNHRDYILIAAYNSGTEARNSADYLCTSNASDNVTLLQGVIMDHGPVVLAEGTYPLKYPDSGSGGASFSGSRLDLTGRGNATIVLEGVNSGTGTLRILFTVNSGGAVTLSNLIIEDNTMWSSVGVTTRLFSLPNTDVTFTADHITLRANATQPSGTWVGVYQGNVHVSRSTITKTAENTVYFVNPSTGEITDCDIGNDVGIYGYAPYGITVSHSYLRSLTNKFYLIGNGLAADTETVTDSGNLSPFGLSRLQPASGGTKTMVLGDADQGDDNLNIEKVILRDGGAGTAVVSITHHIESDPQVYTMTVGDYLRLVWNGTEWITVCYGNAT